VAALTLVGRTSHGHTMLRAASSSRAGEWNHVLVSKDGQRVSCDCAACVFHPEVREGRLTVKRADVLAGKVKRCCWHLRHAARWAPLRDQGHRQA
jgi:predicted DCC family thiol-disulfide oxidoreductase YuxK